MSTSGPGSINQGLRPFCLGKAPAGNVPPRKESFFFGGGEMDVVWISVGVAVLFLLGLLFLLPLF